MLDEIREIVVKYKQSSAVILVMNASLFLDPLLARDKYLYFKEFVSEMGMSLPEGYPEVQTYRHGSGKSIIDYIVHNKNG